MADDCCFVYLSSKFFQKKPSNFFVKTCQNAEATAKLNASSYTHIWSIYYIVLSFECWHLCCLQTQLLFPHYVINDKSANYFIWAYPFVHVCVVSRTEIQAFLFQQFLIGLLPSNIMRRTFYVALALLANFVANGQGRIQIQKTKDFFLNFFATCM